MNILFKNNLFIKHTKMKHNNYVDIAGRKIGQNYPPLVIAEIGINFGGDCIVQKFTHLRIQ